MLHIRILWGIIDSKQVPSDPPSSLLASFNARVSTQQQLYDCENGPCLLPLNLIKVGSSAPITSSARLATQVRRVEEHVLEYVQACLSRFGLTRWCPDLRQTPYSLFNSACRIIAIDTFKQALISHAYASLAPNTTYVQDMLLLMKIYDHFVHFYQHSRYKRDAKVAGSVKIAEEANPQYHARSRVCNLIFCR